jgi:organic hydroperoxide reductase OsmC/OhrA
MQDYPHHYLASASASQEGVIDVDSPGLATLPTLAPAEFGGPGDLWSPETLFVASIADCFILTFRAVARGSRFEWNSLRCEVEGVLDRIDRVTRFTGYIIRVELHVPAGSDLHKAERLAEKSESVCLITNSLIGEKRLETSVVVDDVTEAAS